MSTKQIKKHEATVEIPKDVKVNLKSNILHVVGPLGKTYKNFKKIPVSIDINDNKIILKSTGTRKKHYAILNTARSIIQTLCEVIVTGYTLKMKIVYYSDSILDLRYFQHPLLGTNLIQNNFQQEVH